MPLWAFAELLKEGNSFKLAVLHTPAPYLHCAAAARMGVSAVHRKI